MSVAVACVLLSRAARAEPPASESPAAPSAATAPARGPNAPEPESAPPAPGSARPAPAPATETPAPAESTPGPTAPAPVLVPAPAPAASVSSESVRPAVTDASPAPVESASSSDFERPPLTVSVGHGDRRLSLTLYGFVEADFIYDTTRSYADAIGDRLVARTDTYAGTVSRTQFSTRNTRLGLAFDSSRVAGVRPSAVLEADFFGNQPSDPPDSSETAFYDSAAFRLRHAYLRLETDYADLLLGETYDVFGWQGTFFPSSAELLGLPNQVYSRHTQARLSHAFKELAPLSIELAAAASRPAQRDSGTPDLNAGVRFDLETWRGITTSGNASTSDAPLSLGVSGVLRQFRVDAFAPPPTQTSKKVTGWGLSFDAWLPVIPASGPKDRGNALSVGASLVMGSGIGDLMTSTGGARFPTLPNPAQSNPPPVYSGNIDDGLVSFDRQRLLHTIDWRGFRVGLQYYLPPTGRVFIAANYSQAYSKNMRRLFPQGGAEIELLARVADRSRYADVSLFWDLTEAVRFGIAGSYTKTEYIDGDKPHNLRAKAQALYFF